MKYVDLNSDLGESFGTYTLGMDSAIIPQVTSVNVACGFHGGDPVVMNKTVAMAIKNGAAKAEKAKAKAEAWEIPKA